MGDWKSTVYMLYLDQLPQTITGSFFPTLSHVHVVKQDIEGIHRHLVWGEMGEKVLFGIIFVGGGGGGGFEVLTVIDWLFVCRVWNKQLLAVTPKPGVS